MIFDRFQPSHSHSHRTHRIWRRGTRFFTSGFLILFLSNQLGADELVLKSGGRLRGKLISKPSKSGKAYTFQLDLGGQVTLDASQVAEVVLRKDAEDEYESLQPQFANTIEGQTAAAEWCRGRDLRTQAAAHYRRIIEMDPQQAAAWKALGYSFIRGQWVLRRDFLEARGYVFHQGRWRLTQEIELLESKQRAEVAQRDWLSRLKRWQGDLHTERRQVAVQNILSIREPDAVPGIVTILSREKNFRVRKLFVESLSRIEHDDALAALVRWSLLDPHEDVFHACLDSILAKRRLDVAPFYVQSLKHKNVFMVNRAAYSLGELGDGSAVLPLADALYTPVVVSLAPRSGNAMTAAFLADPPSTAPTSNSAESLSASPVMEMAPSGLSTGRNPEFAVNWVPNEHVLSALIKLSGNQNFGFSPTSWRSWYAYEIRNRPAGSLRLPASK